MYNYIHVSYNNNIITRLRFYVHMTVVTVLPYIIKALLIIASRFCTINVNTGSENITAAKVG